MRDIITEMEKFGFSKMEASVYNTLVRYAELNGSQIAKLLNVSRASVYSALENLYGKGVVSLLPGDSKSNMYKAESPKILFEKLKKEYIKSVEYLEKEFEFLEDVIPQEQYWNIKGYDNFILKMKELLFMAEEEIYINTNVSIKQFSEEVKELEKRKVKIILYTNGKVDIENPILEKYEMDRKIDEINKEMILIVDNKVSLIASGKVRGEFLGTFTENPFLIKIASEYIHHNIYMMKLRSDYGLDVFKVMNIGSQREEAYIEELKGFTTNIKTKEKKKVLSLFKKKD